MSIVIASDNPEEDKEQRWKRPGGRLAVLHLRGLRASASKIWSTISGPLIVAVLLISPMFANAGAQGALDSIPPEVSQALDHISADSLRGHLSFISSDLLEGRATPSPGLDIAAEYISAQFRRAGLEPVGDDGYFQTAKWKVVETPGSAFVLRISNGTESMSFPTRQISAFGEKAFSTEGGQILKLSADQMTANPEAARGKVVIVESAGPAVEVARRFAQLNSSAALLLVVDRSSSTGRGLPAARLIDPERTSPTASARASTLIIHDPRLGPFFDSLPEGETPARIDVTIPARVEREVTLKNVIGLLRGADPVLKDTYILVTAHYDHIGIRADLEGDNIFNGANDDGSGTVSVIEMAAALSKLKTRPKRSLVFMTVFGEERGLLGSRYYAKHPIFPLEKTVADINLEQVGRTDSSEGSQVNRATLTGFDFSDIGPIFERAGKLTGIEVYKHPQNSDSFFGRSDNQALADAGIPAHTLCVAFVYPDYHKPGDHWDKVDYVNLTRTNRMVALALWMMGNAEEPPKWNADNPKASRYVEAWKKLQRTP